MEKKTLGRKALTPKEKEAREAFLLNEKPTERTKRVLNPQIKRILKNIDRLISAVKSPRYVFTEEQKQKIVSSIQDKVTTLDNSFKSSDKKEIENIL